MIIEEITASGEPISLDDAREELGVMHRGMDRQITRAITSALRYVERATGRTLRTSVQRKLSLPNFPNYTGDQYWSNVAGGGANLGWLLNDRLVIQPIALLYPPWASTDSVTYFDEDNAEQTIASTNYRTKDATNGQSLLEFDEDYTFPTTKTRLDAVNITYTSGNSSPDPIALAAARLMLIALIDQDVDCRREADQLIQSIRLTPF